MEKYAALLDLNDFMPACFEHWEFHYKHSNSW